MTIPKKTAPSAVLTTRLSWIRSNAAGSLTTARSEKSRKVTSQ